MMLNARFASTCPTCKNRINVGEAILWTRGQPAVHVFCPAQNGPTATMATVKQNGSAGPVLGTTSVPAPAPVAAPVALQNASVILNLLRTAGSRLKWPKITLDQDGQQLRLQIAGPNSRYAGAVMITDGLPYGQNTWYGRIEQDGTFVPSRNATPWVVDTLNAFAADPAGYAARYGHKTGSCCFCARELTTAESTTVGYGPICAGHYGLPWGHTHSHAA